jgi:hypothetical protein
MSNRDFGVSALGRFLAVERYRETCLSPSANQLRSPVPDRIGVYIGTPGSGSGSRAPARPQNG